MRRSIFVLALAVLLNVTHGRGTRADVIGTAAIADLYITYRQTLGAAIGPVEATRVGAKREYARGAIYYSDDTGAIAVPERFWTRYKAMGAENGVLGFPESAVDWSGATSRDDGRRLTVASLDFDNGILVYTFHRPTVRVVRGVLRDVWEKNGRADGPLGVPLGDSDIDVTLVDGAGFSIPLVTAASQVFEGATVSYSRSRALLGGAAWTAEVDPRFSRKVRVQSRVFLDLGSVAGAVAASYNFAFDVSFWAHGRVGDVLEEHLRFPTRFGSDRRYATTIFRVEYAIDSGGALDIVDTDFGFNVYRNGHLYVERSQDRLGVPESVSPMWIASGMEMSTEHDGGLGDGLVAWNESNTTTAPFVDSMRIYRVTIRNTPVTRADIRF